MNFIFPCIWNNHPNWLIFFRWFETTNQHQSVDFNSVFTIDRIMLCDTLKKHTAFEATPPHREAASKWSTTGRSCCEGRATWAVWSYWARQLMEVWSVMRTSTAHDVGVFGIPNYRSLGNKMKHGLCSIISILAGFSGLEHVFLQKSWE